LVLLSFSVGDLLFSRTMGTITTGVEFDTIAREWRCKWSEDNDKASLAKAQEELNKILADLKAVEGVKGVQVSCLLCIFRAFS
jgi:hypothetical protein